jgi:hypothetical protein
MKAMPAASVIVCEKSPRWAAALRGAVDSAGPALLECRSLAQAVRALEESPASLLAVETTAANLSSVVQLLDRLGRQFGQSRCAALFEANCGSWEPLVREAGAIDVLHSTLEAPRLARLARRHLALAPVENLDLDDWISQRMPWPAYSPANAKGQTA